MHIECVHETVVGKVVNIARYVRVVISTRQTETVVNLLG